MSSKRRADPLRVVCPKCGAGVGRPCVRLGTLSGAEPVDGPFTGSHSARQTRANTAPLPAAPAPATCRCLNHLRHPKQQHATLERAIIWAATRPDVQGMRLEPYPCPTSTVWHIRTATKTRTA